MFKKIKHIHLVGVGGSGMSGIAEVLLNLGYKVSGSDLKKTDITKRLEKLGSKICYQHKPKNVSGADVVVFSTAIGEYNPELKAARKNKIPIIGRAEMLAELARIKYTVTVAGTHGKTTTTSLVALVLQKGGFDPTTIIGGLVKNFGSGAKLGKGEFMVLEADESDGSFLKLSPSITVLTNIDDDHLDHYQTMHNLKQAFIDHVNKLPFYGCAVMCVDDSGVRSILNNVKRRYYTYGIDYPADTMACDIKIVDRRLKFKVVYHKRCLGEIRLNVQGKHNIQNALAAISCGLELEIPFLKIKQALEGFKGVGRRIELKEEINGVVFLDDYGHHPSEIEVTLKTIKDIYPHKRLIVIFQPHRYTRTKILYKKFGRVFKHADIIRLMEIYPAGEKPIPGVSAELILKELLKEADKSATTIEKKVLHPVRVSHPVKEIKLVKSFDDLIDLVKIFQPGDIVLTLGAGDVEKIGEKLISQWKKILNKEPIP